MKEVVLDISEITHSREMYDAKPRPLVSAFIYILIVIIVGAISYTAIGTIDIVVKGNGVVRPNENLSTISATLTGILDTININEGDVVSEGDVLYIINHDYLKSQLSSLEEQLVEVTFRLDGVETFKDSVESGEDLFTVDSIYRNRYLQYLSSAEYTTYQLKASELQL